MYLRHFILVCEKHSEVFRFLHFVIKFATMFGPR
jgi:hypothetical protein